MTDSEDILHRLEREGRVRDTALRQMLIEAGRRDLLAQYDEDMRNLRLGLTTAKSVWHSISDAQRKALAAIERGGRFVRTSGAGCNNNVRCYGIRHDGKTVADIFGLPTLRCLSAHGLLHPDGGALDPEEDFVLTERGQFVLKHGRPE